MATIQGIGSVKLKALGSYKKVHTASLYKLVVSQTVWLLGKIRNNRIFGGKVYSLVAVRTMLENELNDSLLVMRECCKMGPSMKRLAVMKSFDKEWESLGLLRVDKWDKNKSDACFNGTLGGQEAA